MRCLPLFALPFLGLPLLGLPLLGLVGCSADFAVGHLTDGPGRDGPGRDGPGRDGPGRDGPSAGDGSGADAYASAGGGNGVLWVDATISSTGKNTDNGQDFETVFSVVVQRQGIPVTDAVVTISSSAGSLTLSHEGLGRYQDHESRYERRYALEVRAGTDTVTGVRGEGPAVHLILAPLSGERHAAGQPLTSRWTVPSPAQEARVETKAVNSVVLDSGSFVVPGTALAGTAGQDEDDRLRVGRSDQQMIAGGAAGSRLSIGVSNEVEFLIAGK